MGRILFKVGKYVLPEKQEKIIIKEGLPESVRMNSKNSADTMTSMGATTNKFTATVKR